MYWATRARAILLALALSLSARGAHAQPAEATDSPRFHLVYEASAESCPNAPAFLGAIRARTERPRLAAPGESAALLQVTITRTAASPVTGRLEIREPDGTRQERAIESDTCAEVAKALALIAALYLDPDAALVPEPPSLSASPPPPRSRPPEPPPPTAARETGRHATFGIGVGAGVLGGVGPSIAPVAGVFGDVTLAGRRPSWLRPSIRAGAVFATSTGEVVGAQRYFLIAGAVRVCPIELPLRAWLGVGPCAGLQAGVHRGTSQGIPNAQAEDRPWVSPTATLRSSLILDGALGLELEGGVAVPLIETRFFLAPDLTLFRTPPVVGIGTATVTLRFR
jgi:hypothetical protein